MCGLRLFASQNAYFNWVNQRALIYCIGVLVAVLLAYTAWDKSLSLISNPWGRLARSHLGRRGHQQKRGINLARDAAIYA